jgi:hypothetical protein
MLYIWSYLNDLSVWQNKRIGKKSPLILTFRTFSIKQQQVSDLRLHLFFYKCKYVYALRITAAKTIIKVVYRFLIFISIL